MTRLAALPVTGLDAFLQDQRERGGDDALEAQLQAFLDALPPLLPAESVLVHADLTADNILVHDGRLAGFIDFAGSPCVRKQEAVLHRYSHVATMMQRAGHASLRSWLDTLWLP